MSLLYDIQTGCQFSKRAFRTQWQNFFLSKQSYENDYFGLESFKHNVDYRNINHMLSFHSL
jgi:hypothetical protein